MLEIPTLMGFAFVAGLIDAAVGGGGLIQVPGLFATLPQAVPASLLGTNKLSSVFGTFAACWRYACKLRLNWSLILPIAFTAFVFSFLGAGAVSLLSKDLVRPLVLVLMIGMLVYTLWKKDFGANHFTKAIGRRERLQAILMGGGIGFYDGFFGPGTGSFLIFLFIRIFGFDFLHASAAAKVVNAATNLAALAYFVPSQHIMYQYGLPMAVANVAGAAVGTRLAIKGGVGLLRSLFVLLVSVLVVKLIWDIIH